MAVRTAEAEWKGNLREGQGTLKLGSGAYEGSYSFASRFETGKGTNPEELIGAAHAGCFSMALSAGLSKAGFTPTRVPRARRGRIWHYQDRIEHAGPDSGNRQHDLPAAGGSRQEGLPGFQGPRRNPDHAGSGTHLKRQ